MKKSSFVAMVLGVVSGTLFALGMCMVLLPQWNAFQPGIGLGSAGFALGLVTILIWRRMEHKAPIRCSGKTLGAIALGISGALLFGVGMCCCMIWNRMILGTLVGMGGILLLLMLIPLIKGLKD